MTKIVEGRMIITRINLKALKIPPMKGEAIVREPELDEQPPTPPPDNAARRKSDARAEQSIRRRCC